MKFPWPLAILLGIGMGFWLAIGTQHAIDALWSKVYAECDYTPHPISDVAWELYQRGLVPLGTATYYTRMVRSDNIPAADCLAVRFHD